MNVHYAKFQKKFDSRTISRELPFKEMVIVYKWVGVVCFAEQSMFETNWLIVETTLVNF